jgi:hypothetical protein
MNATRLVLRGASGSFNLDGGSMLPKGKFLVKPVFGSVVISSASANAFIRVRSSISAGSQVDSSQDGRLSFYLTPRFHGGGSTTDNFVMDFAQGEVVATSVDTYLTLEFLNPTNGVESFETFCLVLDLIPLM